jgi:LacI family transcriptional regulator
LSIKKIQELTGFSYSTISRVLNGKAKEFRISDKTSQAILEAAEKLSYRPNIVARSLRLQKTMTIGLIVPDIQNPTFAEMASNVERSFREHGYSTILCNANEIPDNEKFYLQVLEDRQVDGIIISPIHTEEWINLENIREKTPIVLISRIFYDTDLPWVTSNNTVAAATMTNELLNLGYKRIAYLGGTEGTYINNVRFQGYSDALTKNSLKVEWDHVMFQGYTPEAGEEMMERLLDRIPDIESVFCVNNMVFFGAMKIVQKHESRLGCSIMMSAFDIGRYCKIFKRPLLSANQDFEIMAKSAVGLLLDRMEDRANHEDQLIVPVSVQKYNIV